MPKVVYWSEDDGAIYLPHAVDGAAADGSTRVEGYLRYQIADSFTLTAEDIAIGDESILEVLLRHKPPLATMYPL